MIKFWLAGLPMEEIEQNDPVAAIRVDAVGQAYVETYSRFTKHRIESPGRKRKFRPAFSDSHLPEIATLRGKRSLHPAEKNATSPHAEDRPSHPPRTPGYHPPSSGFPLELVCFDYCYIASRSTLSLALPVDEEAGGVWPVEGGR